MLGLGEAGETFTRLRAVGRVARFTLVVLGDDGHGG